MAQVALIGIDRAAGPKPGSWKLEGGQIKTEDIHRFGRSGSTRCPFHTMSTW